MGNVLKIFNLLFMIHTDDHNPPHVTVYQGTPKSWEAKAKVNLLTCQVFWERNFDSKSIAVIEALTKQYQNEFTEAWNEIFKDR